jgi:RNA polymerase sigma factor (sigma-70 family)
MPFMDKNNKLWESYYNKNIGQLIGVCYRYVQNKAIAEDLAHDAFLCAINKAESFKSKGSFDGWLYRITVNTALQFLRKKNAMLYFEDLSQLESKKNFEEENSNEEHLIADGDFSHEELLQAIKLLPEHHKIVFNLYVIDHYTHPQIAKELDISVGTSKSHLSRARKKLQTILTDKVLEKQYQKRDKRAWFWFIIPGKKITIDKLYQNKFKHFGLKASKALNFAKLASIKHSAIILKVSAIKTASIIAMSTVIPTLAIIGMANFETLEPMTGNSIKTMIDTNTLNQSTDSVLIIEPDSIVSDTTQEKPIKKAPVVIKKRIIKRKTIVVTKKDSLK